MAPTPVSRLEYALERTADYLKQRIAFGQPLMANQHLAYELADLASEVDLLKYYNYHAAAAQTRGDDITRFATVAKLRSARLARRVADVCLQFHGGVGYIEETWTARFNTPSAAFAKSSGWICARSGSGRGNRGKS